MNGQILIGQVANVESPEDSSQAARPSEFCSPTPSPLP